MSFSRVLHLGLALASVSAFALAAACGGSSDGGSGGSCASPLDTPSCGVITNCDGSTSPIVPTCGSDGWSCPPVPDVLCASDGGTNVCASALALDCGTCNGQRIAQECGPGGWSCPPVPASCEESDGGACPDVAPLCEGCGDGTFPAPICSGARWTCPILGCPIEPDAGLDAGPDAAPDAGPDSGSDAGVGDFCERGAACLEGMSCTVATAGQLPLSCECVDGTYACSP
jgi:hypothetical protein